MAYAPTTDFLALLRQTTAGVRTARMPGLDYVVSALARAGMFKLYVGQVAPTSNQPTTAWLQPSVPSSVAEGILFLWNVLTQRYEAATPALWAALLAPTTSIYSFQSVVIANDTVKAGTTLLAVKRVAPAATGLLLPTIAAQQASGAKLQIADFSTGVVNHTLTLTTPDGATIMQKASWSLLSTPDQLAGIMLQPSPDLNAWVIAP